MNQRTPKPSQLTWLFFYIRALILLLVFACVNTHLYAQVTFESWSDDNNDRKNEEKIIKRGIDHIYNLEFDKANTLFKKIILKYPERPIGFFYDGMVTWWKIMIDIHNEKYDDIFSKKMDIVIDKCDQKLLRDRSDYEALFYKSAALGFRGRLRANRKKWLKAASDAKDALPLVDRLKRIEADNHDVKFGLGIYNYYADAIPQKYPFLKPITLFLPKGDKQKGINQLIESSNKAKYASTEATYFLSKIYFGFEKDYRKANLYAKKLHNLYPKNTFFYEYLARTYYNKRNFKQAQNIYKQLLMDINGEKLTYNDHILRKVYFYLGKISSYNRDHKTALSYFIESDIASSKIKYDNSTFYCVHSKLEIGKMYDVIGKREKAKKYYQKVINLDDVANSHKYATKYIHKPYKR